MNKKRASLADRPSLRCSGFERGIAISPAGRAYTGRLLQTEGFLQRLHVLWADPFRLETAGETHQV